MIMNDDEIKPVRNESFDTNEDFDTDFEGFNTDSSGKSLLNNPLFKVAVIGGALALIIVGIILFGGRNDDEAMSLVGGAQKVSETPGEAETSPDYRERIEDVNQQNYEEAIKSGSSAIPMLTTPTDDLLALPPRDEIQAEDPLERWRRLQAEREERAAQQQQTSAPQGPTPEQTARTEAIMALSEGMLSQMQSVLETPKTYTIQWMDVTSADYLEELAAEEAAAAKAVQDELDKAAEEAAAEEVEIILPAGTIEYGQTLIEANTDSPGPVLATILSGPMIGSRILGSFKKNDDTLTLEFNKIIYNGVDYDIQAIALDPDTTLPAVATDVDRRYFKRLILPTASAFISGVAEAVAESGRTTVTINNDGSTTSTTDTTDLDLEEQLAEGVETAGNRVSAFVDEEASRVMPLIKVAAGTPIGILFLEPITQDDANE